MYTLGIDLGGMSIKAGICDENGNILHQDSCPTVLTEGGDRIVADMADLCRKVIADAGLTVDAIAYAGIASPGINDCDRGIIVYSCNIPTFQFPIAQKLSALTGIERIYIDNDANAAAKGEAVFGAAKGYKDSVFITLGTGVGGGVIIDGKVLTGCNFAGAEMGHMVIVHDGLPCSCGRKGCLECYASATALIRQTKQKMREHPESLLWELTGGDLEKASGRTPFEAMRRGDAAATAVVQTYAGYLACGITNFINIFQPDVLSIGGGVSNARDDLLNPVRAIVEKEQYSRDCEKKTIIKIAELGNRAGIVGAAALGR